jgi:hypothetical protein
MMVDGPEHCARAAQMNQQVEYSGCRKAISLGSLSAGKHLGPPQRPQLNRDRMTSDGLRDILQDVLHRRLIVLRRDSVTGVQTGLHESTVHWACIGRRMNA